MKLPVAICGATGSVGQYFISLLANHPYFKTVLLTASRDYESNYTMHWRASLKPPAKLHSLPIVKTTVANIKKSGARIVFSALPSGVALNFEKELVEAGIAVFSNASAYRMDKNIPILIPEINSNHLNLIPKGTTPHITNSNCTTSGLALTLSALKPLGIKQVYLSTYQALSGAGYPGVASMDILGNVIPHIAGEEGKIREETLKILGDYKKGTITPASFEVMAQALRVAVKNGHLETVFVQVENRPKLPQIKNLFTNYQVDAAVASLPSTPKKTFYFFDNPERPQPVLDVHNGEGMGVSIGSLRIQNNTVAYKLLVNNVIRGAAGGSIQNAEYAFYKGLIH
ncbi:MAG: aspartate-semialdehyde dehydrogenase [Deltaproteobacteria bacterium]|jgi:aspartate-semialdehyde dehydrogenase|nr:aspartate-semialdehyde dehydrogenase [Deltaproteobacteria bacterium]